MKTAVKKYALLPIAGLLCAISVWQFGTAVYIHAKAELAQILVRDAWQNIRRGQHRAKPWPWADTWPVARLTVPRLGIDQMVLAGASGRTLAFGPGWLKESAPPGGKGLSLIAAHRDTHFSFLQQLRSGDRVEIETPGARSVYRVHARKIADSRRQGILAQGNRDELVLVTCYPFDAIAAGGALRYVVFAEKIVLDEA